MKREEFQRIKIPADNYGRVYIGMLESKLSTAAKLCYGVMWSFGQDTWASQSSIGRRMSAGRNTVRKAQQELSAAGWIIQGPSALGEPLVWGLIPPAQLQMNGESGGGVLNNCAGGCLDSEQGGAQILSTKKELKQEEIQEALTLAETPTQRPPLKEKEDSAFAQFWAAYPKKSGKLSASKEWDKAKPPLDLVLKAIAQQKRGRQWLEGFILDPERWIKRGCWMDEPPADASGPKRTAL